MCVLSNVKIVCSLIDVCNILRALSKNFWNTFFSSSLDKFLSPVTYVTFVPLSILFAPTIFATSGNAVICTTGIPALSILAPIVAPQRVEVPQADVNITASTLSSTNLLVISSPIIIDFFIILTFPQVLNNVECSFPIRPCFSYSLAASMGSNLL